MWEEENFFENCQEYMAQVPCGSKISTKSLYLAQLGDRSKFVFCHFWQKFENSKWPLFLGRGKFFENCQEYIVQVPCG